MTDKMSESGFTRFKECYNDLVQMKT